MEFIKVYKKAFDDDFCKKVIDCFNIAEQNGLIVDRQNHDKVPKLEKEDLATYVPHFPMQHSDKEIFTEFNDIFWNQCYKEYANKLSILSQCAHHSIYTMKIQKTKPGEGYHLWHAETTNKNSSNRLLTWTVYLNDDFEAGETEFLYQHYRYKPQKGDCIIFPAAFTHTHRGNPPIGGDKYIITGWVEF
jgi:hypothetical protein